MIMNSFRKQFDILAQGGIFLPHETLPLALGQFKGEHSLDIPIILSVLVLSVLPMIILFIIFQDKLVKGIMKRVAGASDRSPVSSN